MRAPLLFLLLAASGCILGSTRCAKETTIELLSAPIKLRYGQVHNTWQEPIDLPDDVVKKFENGTMALVDYMIDIVYENGSRVPLYDTYNHHYYFNMGTKKAMNSLYDFMQDAPYGFQTPDGLEGWVKGAKNPSSDDEDAINNRKLLMSPQTMAAMRAKANEAAEQDPDTAMVGSASGAEERGTPHRLPEGYAYLVDTPEALAPLFHFINTKAPDSLPEEQLKTGEYSPFLQCPCTPQRVLNEENGTVDGWKPFPPFGTCSKQFYELENPSCSLETYKGGWRCCENGNYLIDTDNYNVDEFPEDVVYGKFLLTFLDDDARELGIKETTALGHDVTGDLETRGNVEFDVPQCENGTLPEDCIYEQSTVMYADGGIDGSVAGKMSIPYTVGHLHVGGIDISLYDDSTGELICRSEAIYGNGTEPANEENYIVGMTPCIFDDPPVFNNNDKLRIVSRYNNTKPHLGVMGLFLGTKHEIDA